MPTQVTPKELPALDKVPTADLRAWRDVISTPFLAFFLTQLESIKRSAARVALSPVAMREQSEKGRDLGFWQGKSATINEIQAWFKDVEIELTNRQHRAATQRNADNEQQRRRRQPQ